MIECTSLDHDRLDVHRLSIIYVASSFAVAEALAGLHRSARDQWHRVFQWIRLRIARATAKATTKIEIDFGILPTDRQSIAYRFSKCLPQWAIWVGKSRVD